PPSTRYEPEVLDAFLALLPRDTDAALALARLHEPERMQGRTALPEGPNRRLRHALEIRHESFDDPGFIRLLRRHRVALVVSDTPGRFPSVEDVSGGFRYLRLHGGTERYRSGYSDEALDRWAPRIRRWADGGVPDDARRLLAAPPPRSKRHHEYCYFDNHDKVQAPGDAHALTDRLACR